MSDECLNCARDGEVVDEGRPEFTINIIFLANGSGVTQPAYWDHWRKGHHDYCKLRVHQADGYVERSHWEHLPTRHPGYYWEERYLGKWAKSRQSERRTPSEILVEKIPQVQHVGAACK